MTSSELSDLIGQVALGDRVAFDRLYARTSAKLFGVCLRLLRDRGEAEEVLQEVYVKVWHNARTYRVQGYSAVSWLVAVARNHAIDRLRARKPEASGLDDAIDIPDDRPDPEHAALGASDRSLIERCLGELTAEKAEAVRHAYIDGLSYQELADRYRVPLNTMRTWLRRSLISLRECIGR